MNVTKEALNRFSDQLATTGVFALRSDLNAFMSKVEAALKGRYIGQDGGHDFSLSRWIRGQAATKGIPIAEATRQEDINYFEQHVRQTEPKQRALTTGSGAGSYLVPEHQAEEIIGFLSAASVLRQAKVRMWPMVGREKLRVALASSAPTVEWLGENTAQTATDPGLGQMQFDLKTARCLTAVPIELIQTSEPAIDRLLAELIGTAMGVAEDTAFFATSNTTNGPNSIYADYASLTNHTVGESANGGNLAYTDITRTLYKSAAANARGPLVWFMSPRTFWSRIVGLIDGTSRPIFVPFPEGLAAAVPGRLMGYPVYVTSVIPEDQTVGSGSSQSYLLLTNPTYLHIAEPPNGVELAVSSEFLFSSAQVAIRGIKRVSFGWSPKLGTTILRGIN